MFDELIVFDDVEPRAAALNMAIDEALLASATEPTLRIYQWRRPALSFGYFGRFADVAEEEPRRELVRRWTGGGIVLHGSDLTYSVVLPSYSLAGGQTSRAIYALIHGGIRRALAAHVEVTLAAEAAPRISEACFANPVATDVMANGRKIAGAAHRRTRAGLLHQGSILFEPMPEGFSAAFAAALCERWAPQRMPAELLARAEVIAAQKYASESWLRRR